MEVLLILFVLLSLVSRIMGGLSRKAAEDAKRAYRPARSPAERAKPAEKRREEPDIKAFKREKTLQRESHPRPKMDRRLERPVPRPVSMEQAPQMKPIVRAAADDVTETDVEAASAVGARPDLAFGIVMSEILGRPKSVFAPRPLSLARRHK